jgi:hypothetical protein
MNPAELAHRWKELYWQAIEEGLEAGEAEQFANRALSREFGAPVNFTRHTWSSEAFGPGT